MKNYERMNNHGKKLVATVKSYLVTTKQEIQTGKLEKKGENAKYFTGVKYNKIVPTDEKVCLRIAYKRFDGKTLVYIHSWGWTEVENLNEIFASQKEIKEDLYNSDYSSLSPKEKIQLFKTYFPEKFENLNKTETMLMAYLEDKNLSEIEKEIAADKSLKYKIKKNTETFENTFLKKLEGII